MKSALTTVLITLLTLETVQASSDNYKKVEDTVVLSPDSEDAPITSETWNYNSELNVEWYGDEIYFYLNLEDNYIKVGDTVVLSPGSVDAPITSITWKHNSNLAVEWYGGLPDVYPKFKGRCTLNTTTGELTISGLTLKDSGSYTPEINNRFMNPTEITVITEVPTPTISKRCDAEKTHCIFTCEGNTADAGPVMYSWILYDMVLLNETKEFNITKKTIENSIGCIVQNPVSYKWSARVPNPFIINYNNQSLILSAVVVLILVAVVGVVNLVLYKRKCKGKKVHHTVKDQVKNGADMPKKTLLENKHAAESSNQDQKTAEDNKVARV